MASPHSVSWSTSSHGILPHGGRFLEHAQSTPHAVQNDVQDQAVADLNSNSDQARDPPAVAPELTSEARPGHRFMTTIDWRGEICQFLNLSPVASNEEVSAALDEARDKLQELERLRALTSSLHVPPRYQIIHTIRCQRSREENAMYLNEPYLVEAGPYDAHLRGTGSIHNLELYLERNRAVFVVCRDYECCNSQSPVDASTTSGSDSDLRPSAFLTREHVIYISPELKLAFTSLSKRALLGVPHPDFAQQVYGNEQINYPYMWWFHRRDEIEVATRLLMRDSQRHLNVFQDYLQTFLFEEWRAVQDLTARNKITANYIDYLFIPQDILISWRKGNTIAALEGFQALSGLNKEPQNHRRVFSGSIEVSYWTFDGNFQNVKSRITIDQLPSMTQEFDIQDLVIYPIRFSSPETTTALKKRGEMFWECRTRKYVSYKVTGDADIQAKADSRFMVDMATYKQMHPDPRATLGHAPNRDDLGPEVFSQNRPLLGDSFYFCLPSTTSGFNMQKKEWVSLEVALIQDVVWDTEAFSLLVVDQTTKELIQAVVTNQIKAEQNTDLIRGKGNGLFILLHGGPGTGKTLTAESVAELAKRPLYRVTCGDIGTKAEEVEKYLEVVMMLGKTWGCVVLLDEADVFLEQRSLASLERNALVSVFLRVLEYYDGILILTSNRVGIFDEAFKSRIQLNLRYKNLDYDQRLQIWDNFITRLETLQKAAHDVPSPSTAVGQTEEIGYNAAEIRANIKTLAKPPLNGREIRNAISTARQLAMFRRQPLGYVHLDIVIRETTKFDEYLVGLHRGFSADDIQKDKEER